MHKCTSHQRRVLKFASLLIRKYQTPWIFAGPMVFFPSIKFCCELALISIDLSSAAFQEFVKHENLTMEQHYDLLSADMALPSLIRRPSDSNAARHIEARVWSLTQKICYFSHRWLGTPSSISKTSYLLRLLLTPHIGNAWEWKNKRDQLTLLASLFGDVKPCCPHLPCNSSEVTQTRWGRIRNRVVQEIISQTQDIMRQVIEERDQEFPVWNPEWWSLKNMFPFSPHIPLSYGDVLMFVSHIIANIEIYWQTRRYLSSPGMPYMPREIVDMIHDDVIRKKGVRQLPQEGFCLEPELGSPAHWNRPVCRDCPCDSRVTRLTLSASRWQYSLRTVCPGGWQGVTWNHSKDCNSEVPLESMEEAQGKHNGLYGDPADIMPPCPSCHKKWGS